MKRMLEGKVAIVTGAGQGIGLGIASIFFRKGARVILLDINEELGKRAANELRSAGAEAIFIHGDVTTEESAQQVIAAALETWGQLHILVNNAGTNVFVDPLEATDDDWDRCMELDLKSLWRFSKHAARAMREHGGGSIINIASIHAFQTSKGSFPYAVAKTGVVGLTRVLALDLAPYQIRVNALCPGWTDTPLAEAYFREQRDPDAARREVERIHPLSRIGTPEDMGYATAFLASDEAAFITGTTLLVDGGLAARQPR